MGKTGERREMRGEGIERRERRRTYQNVSNAESMVVWTSSCLMDLYHNKRVFSSLNLRGERRGRQKEK